MAIAARDLPSRSEARIYRFPTGAVRARARRQALARRLAGVVLVAVLVTALVVAARPGGGVVASRKGAPLVAVLEPGDSLWSVAARYARPGVDRRAYVDALAALNHLDGPVRPGQRIRLPSRQISP